MAPTMDKLTLLLALMVVIHAAVCQAAQRQVAATSKKVTMQLYYEALCPYSISFIKDQVEPTFKTLGPELMAVDFFPYGHANRFRSNTSETGITFYCQHGPKECRGNELQACGLARLQDNSKQVKFVSCVMSQSDPSRPSDTCITDVGLDASEVNDCTDGTEGLRLMNSMADKTPSSFLKVTGVPAVYFNGEFDWASQNMSDSNLLSVVCNKLVANVRPAVCERSASSTSSGSVISLLLSCIFLTSFVR